MSLDRKSFCTAPAFAQAPADDFESELKAFKQKAEAARNASAGPAPSPSPVAAVPASPVASGPAVSPIDSPLGAGPSPLGPAANLPVNGELPPGNVSQTAEEMAAQAEAELQEQQRKMDEATFNDALKMLLPLKPAEIRRMLNAFKDSREAAETPITDPKPVVQVETVSLDPSQVPPVIKTSPIRVTTLTILDSTGSPWPIQDVSWAGKFDVVGPEEGGHVIRITPQTAHGTGNVSIRLVDLITPVTFTLQSGLDEVYYRFDARIPKAGPLAKAPLIEYGGLKAIAGNDDNLVQVLDGTPPAGSEKMKVEGVDGRTSAWRASGRLYLRTPLTLLSPSWDSSVMSADGMNVYTLGETPVILLSDGGQMVRAQIATDEAMP